MRLEQLKVLQNIKREQILGKRGVKIEAEILNIKQEMGNNDFVEEA